MVILLLGFLSFNRLRELIGLLCLASRVIDVVMGHSIWKGHVAFGMVSFPVRLCAAARTDTISFNQLHACDHSRVKQVLYCQGEDRPVSREELVKGYEYEKGHYVIVDEADLKRAAPPSGSVMEVLEFVPAADVDPVFRDASYYVQPDVAGERAYALLLETLRRTGHVGIAQWTLHSREHLVLLRPGRTGLVLHTMYYVAEVRAMDEFRADTSRISDQEVELATLLVKALAGAFTPDKYQDNYQVNLRAVLDAKVQGKEMEARAGQPALAPVVDILEALKASLARKTQPETAAERRALVPRKRRARLRSAAT
jgi:DNA end-binding protein Ku